VTLKKKIRRHIPGSRGWAAKGWQVLCTLTQAQHTGAGTTLEAGAGQSNAGRGCSHLW